MKKFLLKCVLIVAVFSGINFAYKNTEYWKTSDYVGKFNKVPKNIQLANMGNSHASIGIDYSDFENITCFNFAVPAQNFSYDNMILKQYINNFDKGAVLLIPVSYFQVYYYLEEGELSDLLKQKYYRFLKPKIAGGYFDKWKLSEYVRYDLFPICSKKDFYKYLIHDEEQVQTNCSKASDNLEKFKNDVEYKYNFWLDYYKFGNVEENFNLIVELVNLCQKKNITPVFVTIPVSSEITQLFEQDEGFFEGFDLFFERLKVLYPNIKHLDYSRTCHEISDNLDLFFDADHMNSYGASKFSKILLEDLKKCSLIQ